MNLKSFIEGRQAIITPENVLQYAKMGIVASQDNCAHAIKNLNERGITSISAATAHKVINALRSGLLPSVGNCDAALQELKNHSVKSLH